MCGEFFEKNVGDDKWMKNYSLNLTVQSEESDSKKNTETFLDVIVTKAETGNVHSKWGTFKKNRSLNESLTEIIVNIQQIDLILNFDELLFFQPILSELTKTKETSTSFATTSSSFAGVSNLPLFHLKSNGFRIFVPSINECNSPADVIILKVLFEMQ